MGKGKNLSLKKVNSRFRLPENKLLDPVPATIKYTYTVNYAVANGS